MKKNQLSINMIANIVSFAIAFLINFFLTPFLIEAVGKESYSFYPLANSFINYGNFFVLALNSMAGRFISIELIEGNLIKAKKYFNSVLAGNIILAVLLTIPMLFMIKDIELVLEVPLNLINEVTLLFGLIFFSMIISLISSIFGVSTFCKNRIDLRSYQQLGLSLIRAVLIMGLLIIFKPTIVSIGVTSVVIALLTLISNYNFTRRLMPEVQISFRYFDFKCIKILISSGIWNSFNQLSSILLSGLDLLIVNKFLGVTLGAEYAIVQTIPNFIKSFVGMLVGIFTPQLTHTYAKKNYEGLISETKFANKIMGLLVNIPIAIFVVFGADFYKLWVPGEDALELQWLSIIIMAPLIISGSINTLYNLNTVLNKIKIPSMVLFITGLVNVLMVIMLLNTTQLGLFAIPIVSSGISIIRNLIFTPIYPCICLKIKWYTFYSEICKNLIGTLSIIIVGMLLRTITNINTWFDLIFIGGICGIVGLIINGIIVLDSRELRLIKNKINALILSK